MPSLTPDIDALTNPDIDTTVCGNLIFSPSFIFQKCFLNITVWDYDRFANNDFMVGCVKGMSRVCQGCIKGVSRVCQGCIKGVSRVCQGCVRGVSRVCQGYVRGVSRVCQGCIRGVSRVCQGCVRGVSRVCQGCVRGMSRVSIIEVYLVFVFVFVCDVFIYLSGGGWVGGWMCI